MLRVPVLGTKKQSEQGCFFIYQPIFSQEQAPLY